MIDYAIYYFNFDEKYVLHFYGNYIIILFVKKIFFTINNPLLIIYTPLETADSSPVSRFTLA